MRRALPQLAIWIVALLAGGWVWVAAINTVLNQPPPLRPLSLDAGAGTPLSVNDLLCADGSAFIDAGTYWFGPCYLEDQPGKRVIIRVIPAEARIDAHWSFETTPNETNDTVDWGIRVMASSEAGTLFVQYVSYSDTTPPELFERYFLLHPDRVEELPPPAINARNMRAAVWVREGDAEQVNVISIRSEDDGREEAPDWQIYVPGQGWQVRTLPQPDVCDDCRLQTAYYEPDGWRLLYLNIPQGTAFPPSDDEQPLSLPLSSVILADAEGQVLPLELASNQLSDPTGVSLVVVPGLFEPAVGNVINYISYLNFQEHDAVPYVYRDGTWQPFALPPASVYEDVAVLDDFFLTQYGIAQRFDGQQSRWQPQIRAYAEPSGELALFQISERWLRLEMLQSQEATLREGDAALTLRNSLFPFYAILFPATNNDLWWVDSTIGPGGSMRLDDTLRRVDAVNAFERVVIALNEDGPVWWGNAKTAGMFGLAGLPLLIVLFVILRRRALGWDWAWVPLLYVIVVLLTSEPIQTFVNAL
ncbi:MAG: hypothetical protein SF029_05715 [bacterium]|nr:hypothetical protein [bacterium]